MAAITNTKEKPTEFAGQKKLWIMNELAIASASDTYTMTAADNGISTILGVIVCPASGQDAAFTAVAATFSGLVITITSVEQDGTDSTAWTDTTVNLLVIGY